MSLSFEWVDPASPAVPGGLRLRIVARESAVEGAAPGVLAGSYEDVAERISEYVDLGFDRFLLVADEPDLEREHFARGVVPALERRGLVQHEAPGDVLSPGAPRGV